MFMKEKILLLAIAAATFTSCTTAYKTGQTPDDVYYSPAKPEEEYVKVEKEEDRYQSYEEYQDEYRNDRFMRMAIRNRTWLGTYNDYAWNDWRYNSWNYNSLNSPWNSYWAWNNYYNPYCGNSNVVIVNPKYYNRQPVSRPIAFNTNSYKPRTNITSAYKSGSSYRGSTYSGRYNNSNNNNGSSFSNSLRKVFSNTGSSGSNNSYTPSNNTSTPTRSYTPSSSGSSSGGSSGSGGGVSRPTRGGGK